MAETLLQRIKEANGIVFILVAVFAFSSWIDLYGVYVELPVLVRYLPEGWSLPSVTGLVITAANIGPLLYALINLIFPGNMQTRETFTIYFIMISGALTCILMSFFWDHTTFFAGAERSLAFFAMVFFLSLVDCTSCVVFLPFMSRLKVVYMPSYIAGEEMGGLISGLVGLVQGAGGEPRCINVTKEFYNETSDSYYNVTSLDIYQDPPMFSVSVFFWFLFGIMCTSVIAFTLLNYTSYCKREMIKDGDIVDAAETQEMLHIANGHATEVQTLDDQQGQMDAHELPKYRFPILVFYFAYSAFYMYGFGPAVLSFAVLPYGYFEFNLSLRLSTVINPIVAFSTFLLHTSSIAVIGICIALGNVMSFFIIYLAAMSPSPPLVGTIEGSIMVVTVQVMLTTLYSFARTTTATLMRKEAGHRGLLWAGFSVQAGSCIGTVLGFLLVSATVMMISLYSFARTTTATLMRKEAGHRGLLWAGISVQVGSCLGTILGFVLVNVVQLFQEKIPCETI